MVHDIFIEYYSERSFVVRGDTERYKESLKSLGGKWNSNLTDKNNNNTRFGAWLFWSDKKETIENWIKHDCKTIPETKTNVGSGSLENRIKYLELKVEQLSKIISSMTVDSNKTILLPRKIESDIDDDEPDVTTYVKPKRLLLRK